MCTGCGELSYHTHVPTNTHTFILASHNNRNHKWNHILEFQFSWMSIIKLHSCLYKYRVRDSILVKTRAFFDRHFFIIRKQKYTWGVHLQKQVKLNWTLFKVTAFSCFLLCIPASVKWMNVNVISIKVQFDQIIITQEHTAIKNTIKNYLLQITYLDKAVKLSFSTNI